MRTCKRPVRRDRVHKSCQATARSECLISRRVHRARPSNVWLVCGHEDSTAVDGGWPRSEAVLYDRDGTNSAGSFACIHGRYTCDKNRIQARRAMRLQCIPIWTRVTGVMCCFFPKCVLFLPEHIRHALDSIHTSSFI